MFCKDTAVAGEGQDDVERHTETRAGRLKTKRSVEGVLDPFTGSIFGRMWRHHMVGPATCLIVRHEHSSLVPILAGHKSMGHSAMEPGAILRRVWQVLREVLRNEEVSHFREISVLCVLKELVEARNDTEAFAKAVCFAAAAWYCSQAKRRSSQKLSKSWYVIKEMLALRRFSGTAFYLSGRHE